MNKTEFTKNENELLELVDRRFIHKDIKVAVMLAARVYELTDQIIGFMNANPEAGEAEVSDYLCEICPEEIV